MLEILSKCLTHFEQNVRDFDENGRDFNKNMKNKGKNLEHYKIFIQMLFEI